MKMLWVSNKQLGQERFDIIDASYGITEDIIMKEYKRNKSLYENVNDIMETFKEENCDLLVVGEDVVLYTTGKILLLLYTILDIEEDYVGNDIDLLYYNKRDDIFENIGNDIDELYYNKSDGVFEKIEEIGFDFCNAVTV